MFRLMPPQSAHKSRRSSAFLSRLAAAAIALFLASAAPAQHSAAHSAPAPLHSSVVAGGAYRAAAPVRTSAPQMMRIAPQPRPGWATHPHFLIAPSSSTGIPARTLLLGSDLRAGFGTPRFIRPFFFAQPLVGEFGVAGSISQFGGLPLGFGLWPACDSASTPGVFWTVGPCFGLGSYSAQLAPAAAPPASYVPPLILFSPPPSGAPQPQPQAAPGPPPTLTLYLVDGSAIAAKDWWVAQGRLQYITDSGQTGAVDVLKLDLNRTIKENQKRGLDFRLKFTAPSDVYPPSIRP